MVCFEHESLDKNKLQKTLEHFNWGAAFYTWLWGLGNGCFNKTWVVLVLQAFMWIPIVNFILLLANIGLMVYYGIKGNEWAYEGRAWWNLDDFEATQKRWATVVAVTAGIFAALILFYILLFGAVVAFGAMGGSN